MDKEKRLNKIKDVEHHMPERVYNLGVVSSIVLWAGIIIGLIVVVVGFAALDEEIIGMYFIISGIAFIALCCFSSVFFAGMKEITANTYRSAEYAKIQLEIACSDENENSDADIKVQIVDDELPML